MQMRACAGIILRVSGVRGVSLQVVVLSDPAGADQGCQASVDGLQRRVEALEKELADSENTHRLRCEASGLPATRTRLDSTLSCGTMNASAGHSGHAGWSLKGGLLLSGKGASCSWGMAPQC